MEGNSSPRKNATDTKEGTPTHENGVSSKKEAEAAVEKTPLQRRTGPELSLAVQPNYDGGSTAPKSTPGCSSGTSGGPSSLSDGVQNDDSSQIYIEYKRRWFILILFIAYSMSNAFQWIEYSIIANIISKYYGVDAAFVDWCSMLYMVTYIPLIFPGSWILQKKGLRFTVIMGSLGTMIGSWIKCASVSPDRFYVTFLGQFITACSQIFILSVPTRLAAVWFGSTQVSTACSIGVFGNQAGIALGFLIPPMLVPDSDDVADVEKGLYIMFFSVAGICTVIFIIILIWFVEKPETVPSGAAASSGLAQSSASYTDIIIRLMKNRSYMLLLISYGINVGVFYAVSTLLSQIVLQHFPDENLNAGRIGLLIVVAGMLGSILCGEILDKTSRFKLVTLTVYLMSLLFMVAYTFVFDLQVLAFVFVVAGALGFFMTGYLPVGFEFAAELTFPEPEGTSSGLLNASAQSFGLVFTMAGSALLRSYGDKASNGMLASVLVLGAIITAAIKEDLKRQKAMRNACIQDGPRT
uniref:Choline/ethanolamine transporter FLVCR1 n=1 Tax=Hirondellea gigas TaxID=1518452 RepID=A0A6A7FVC5_9CRUS